MITRTLGFLLSTAVLGASALAGPVALPTFQPAGGSPEAPVHVTVRCATPDAEIHVTLDGAEPTQRDTEIDSGDTVIVDHPLTLKARAWLPDGSVSEIAGLAYAVRPARGNRASFHDQSVPSFMATGQKTKVAFSLRNIGATTWTAEGYGLAPRKAKDAETWQIVRAGLRGPVPTWGIADFEFEVTAPAKPGTYNFDWRMQGPDGASFGEAVPMKRVNVVPPAEYELLVARFAGSLEESATGSEATSRSKDKSKSASTSGAPIPLPSGIAPGSELARLYKEITRSPRSFRYLRTIGFNHSDEEFQMIVTRNSGIFDSTRIVRRDESGKRIIPGWPGVKLKKK